LAFDQPAHFRSGDKLDQLKRRVMLWTVFAAVAHAAAPQFAAHEIATGLKGGYQVTVVDIDHDGKPAGGGE